MDVNGNYAPENCKWITRTEQRNNTRGTLWVEYEGERVQLKAICDRLGVSYDTVHGRIYKRGWDVKRALEEPSHQKNTLSALCRERGINPKVVRDRVSRLGWSLEDALDTPNMGKGANSTTYSRFS